MDLNLVLTYLAFAGFLLTLVTVFIRQDKFARHRVSLAMVAVCLLLAGVVLHFWPDDSVYQSPDASCVAGAGFTVAGLSEKSEASGLRLQGAAWSIVDTKRNTKPYDYQFNLQFAGKRVESTSGVLSLLVHPDPNFKNSGWDRWYQYYAPIKVLSNGCATFPALQHDDPGDSGMHKDIYVTWLTSEDAQHLTDVEERSATQGITLSALPAGRVILGKFTVTLP